MDAEDSETADVDSDARGRPDGRDGSEEPVRSDRGDGPDGPDRSGGRDGPDGPDRSIGRRRVLQTGLSLGAVGVLAYGGGRAYLDRNETGTITYALARSEPGAEDLEPRTKEVPKQWHEALRVAFEVQDRIRDAAIAPMVDAFVVPAGYDEAAASIAVSTTEEDIRETIGSFVESTPVDLQVSLVEDIPPRPEPSDSPDPGAPYTLSELDPDAVPGGVYCEAGDHGGTLTSALYDAESGTPYFATSNHVFGAGGTKETEHRGEPLEVPADDGSHTVGQVDRGYPDADVVRVEPDDPFTPAPALDTMGSAEVVGQYTKAGLADLAARDEPLTKVGAMTGETTGQIRGVDGVTCYTGRVCKTGQLKWGDEGVLTDGDSGSVNFHVDEEADDGHLLVGGINNARSWWPAADFAWGTAAHQLLDEHGLHF